MGLVSRFALFFRGRSAHPEPRREAGAPPAIDPLEASEDLAPFDSSDRALVEVRPLSVAPRRNKQELLDDLERRYHEVVELVRKVDAHLDKADERADRTADLARRLLDAVERLSSSDSEHDQRRHAEHVELLNRLIQTQSSGADRLDTTLTRLGAQAEAAGHSREQLVMTMAEFRETMSDVARSNARGASALEEGARLQHERDERLSTIIGANQRRMIGILVASMTLAAAALVVAFIALFTMRG